MKKSWNDRYSQEEYVYGKQPNRFFTECLTAMKPGKILFLGEGEGRNAVHAAKSGWKVDAMDGSESAREKANRLATDEKVEIKYFVEDLADFAPKENYYDVVVLIFLHLPENLRTRTHSTAQKALKPGGYIILEAFEKNQIDNTSGGPKNIDLLYNFEDIFSDFRDLDLKKFEKANPFLDEGPLHQGKAATIRFLGEK